MFETISFLRVIKAGFINFWRNLWLSLAASMVMVITLVILSTILILFALTSFSVKSIKDRVDISVYFQPTAMEDQILNIKTDLLKNPKVQNVTYISAQQALADFKSNHQADPLILESLNELSDNPLPATLKIQATNLEDYQAINSQLGSDQYKNLISKINYQDNQLIIDRLNKILKFIVTFGIILAIIFALIAILVITNTITLTIYNRREEVEIMRLVGATNGYIRGPFLVESVLYSLVATIICAALFFPVFMNILPKITQYLSPGVNIFDPHLFNFWYLLLAQFAVAMVLSVLSSLLAIRRYLKI